MRYHRGYLLLLDRKFEMIANMVWQTAHTKYLLIGLHTKYLETRTKVSGNACKLFGRHLTLVGPMSGAYDDSSHAAAATAASPKGNTKAAAAAAGA